jgi:hypothetical protein
MQILFIGPASREDRGFLHSYDVVVDSYMSEEDISAGWFKMGGRMVRFSTSPDLCHLLLYPSSRPS